MRRELSRCWARVFIAGIALSLALSACSQTSRINTVPDGASVKINGIYVGTTPCIYRSRSGTPETYYVEVDKEGYKPLRNVTIDRAYRADISLALLILAIFPYFFSARLEEQYVWPLEEDKPGSGTAAPVTPPPGSGTAAPVTPPPPPPPGSGR